MASGEDVAADDTPVVIDSWDDNDDGRATAMTLLVPMRSRWETLKLHAVLQVLGRVHRLTELKELSFIHFAHWSVMKGLPGGAGAPPAGTRYMLFESNFNGTWNEYIEDFCNIVGGGIKQILQGTEGFPGLFPVRTFKSYMEEHETVAGHYWSAYRESPTTVIRAALELQDGLARLRQATAQGDPTAFATAWHTTLGQATVQANLAGRAHVAPHNWGAYLRNAIGLRSNRGGAAYAFISLTPVKPGATADLKERLCALERGAASPFAEVAGTHFGRWVVIHQLSRGDFPYESKTLVPAWLLFTAVFDVNGGRQPGDYLRHLLTTVPQVADEVWGECDGWPATGTQDQKVTYLRRHQRNAPLVFAGYPADVGAVRRAVDERRRLLGLARQAQRLGDDELRAAFLETFPSQGDIGATP